MSGGGGGKGTTTTKSEVKIDPRMQEAALDLLDLSSSAAALPYSPNKGITLAAFTPQQQAAMGASNSMAASLGMQTGAVNLPTPQTNNMGVQGYSTGGLYDEMKDASMGKGYQTALNSLFADNQTGTPASGKSPLLSTAYGGGKGAGGKTGAVNKAVASTKKTGADKDDGKDSDYNSNKANDYKDWSW